MATAMNRAAWVSLKAAMSISQRLWLGLRMEILNGDLMISSALQGLNKPGTAIDTLNDGGGFSQLGWSGTGVAWVEWPV